MHDDNDVRAEDTRPDHTRFISGCSPCILSRLARAIHTLKRVHLNDIAMALFSERAVAIERRAVTLHNPVSLARNAKLLRNALTGINYPSRASL